MRIVVSLGLGAILVVSSGAAWAKEISETMAKPVRATLFSPKQPYDLEVCVADAITQIGGAMPIPIRNGERDVMILGYGHTPKLIISLNAIGNGTRLEVRTRTSDFDDKLIRHLKESCQL